MIYNVITYFMIIAGSKNHPTLDKSCKKEVFRIYKFGGGIIRKGDKVHFKRQYCPNPGYVTGKDETYVETTDYHGSCENWYITFHAK